MTPTPTLNLVLASSGGQVLIPLDRACEIAGFSVKTWRNWDSEGRDLPFPATLASQGPRRVHALDLAAGIDRLAAQATQPTPAAPTTPSTPAKRGRGRPPKSQGQEGGAV